jgi:hypothetical protein
MTSPPELRIISEWRESVHCGAFPLREDFLRSFLSGLYSLNLSRCLTERAAHSGSRVLAGFDRSNEFLALLQETAERDPAEGPRQSAASDRESAQGRAQTPNQRERCGGRFAD